MDLLARELIMDLHAAAVTLKLRRDALLAGLDPRFAASLPELSSASSQLLSDLGEMNRIDRLDDGSVPLRAWLENALALTGGRVEADVFKRALRALLRAAPPRAAPRARNEQPAPAAPPEPIEILLVFANPKGTSPLRLASEERALLQSMKLAPAGGRFAVEALHAATVDDLRRALLAKRRAIVHFAGHGEIDGLRFEDERGGTFMPDSGALADLLRRRGVETVVLNACYSLAIVQATPMGVRYTVAMDGEVGDSGAIEFVRGFYDSIASGQSVEDAYHEGLSCAALKHVAVKAVLVKA